MRADDRPFSCGDAVDGGVAQRAVSAALMRAQHAVELRAQAFDRAPALQIQAVGAEFDRDAVELLESMAEQQQLGFGVHGAALAARSQPGRADFDPPVDAVDLLAWSR